MRGRVVRVIADDCGWDGEGKGKERKGRDGIGGFRLELHALVYIHTRCIARR